MSLLDYCLEVKALLLKGGLGCGEGARIRIYVICMYIYTHTHIEALLSKNGKVKHKRAARGFWVWGRGAHSYLGYTHKYKSEYKYKYTYRFIYRIIFQLFIYTYMPWYIYFFSFLKILCPCTFINSCMYLQYVHNSAFIHSCAHIYIYIHIHMSPIPLEGLFNHGVIFTILNA